MNKYTTAQRKAQNYLRTIKSNEHRIKLLESEIEMQQARLSLNGVAYGENVSKTLEGDVIEQGFVKLYELCDNLDTELVGYVEEREEAYKVLSNLTNPNFYAVLFYVYFQGMKFRELPYLLHASQRQIFNWHEQALSILYRYLPNNYK